MYLRKSFSFKDRIEREEYHNGRYGAPGMKRQKRRKATPEEIKESNRKNRIKRIRRLILANFQKGDYWTTLTYKPEARPRPPETRMDDTGNEVWLTEEEKVRWTIEAAKSDVQTFLRRMRKLYKKQNEELKYIVETEVGKYGAVHHHLIINRITDTDLMIQRSWDHGGIHNEGMYEEGGFARLAEYISKRPRETDPATGKKNTMKETWFSRSRNLIEVKPTQELMSGKTFRKGPKVPKGYVLDKGSLIEGISVFGYKYRSYTLLKVPELKRRRI